ARISAFVLSLLIGPWLIERLRVVQHGGETIREDTPQRHQTKQGTPTMGGVLILAALLGTTLLWANLGNRYIWVAVLTTAGFGAIGGGDAWKKVRTRKGLPARAKPGLQIVLAAAAAPLVFWHPGVHRAPVPAIPVRKG